jgi:hypothetical protein
MPVLKRPSAWSKLLLDSRDAGNQVKAHSFACPWCSSTSMLVKHWRTHHVPSNRLLVVWPTLYFPAAYWLVCSNASARSSNQRTSLRGPSSTCTWSTLRLSSCRTTSRGQTCPLMSKVLTAETQVVPDAFACVSIPAMLPYRCISPRLEQSNQLAVEELTKWLLAVIQLWTHI